jgi:uncharacterized protein YbbK (DUF523 family)
MTSDPIYKLYKPRVGISRCLLGDEVRYDGGHKRHALLLDALGPQVEWLPVCPEVEVGMGTPREPVHLVAAGAGVRMLGVTSGRDWTDAMEQFASQRAAALKAAGIAGYILKARSPSCDPRLGLFARALADALPDLPVVDEEQLGTREAADAFLARVRAYQGPV